MLLSMIREFFRKIRIEEYFLLFLITFFLTFIYLCNDFSVSKLKEYFFYNFKGGILCGVKYFLFIIYFFWFYIFFKLYLFLGNRFFKFSELKNSNSLSGFFCIKNFYFKLKKFFIGISSFIIIFLLIIIFFALVTSFLGKLAIDTKSRLINDTLMFMDKYILGDFGFIWCDNVKFLNFLAPIISWSFGLLGLMMGIALIVFWLYKSRFFFSKYIISMSLVLIIALPFWHYFPANSPSNGYFVNVYNKKIPYWIKVDLNKYNFDNYFFNFSKKFSSNQVAPVSTFPSMHVAWAIIIAYLFFKLNKKTAFVFFPWCIFTILGTFCLAQHYFVDILLSLPLVLISILFSGLMVKIEKNYYRENKRDFLEEKLKNEIRNDLKIILDFILRFVKLK